MPEEAGPQIETDNFVEWSGQSSRLRRRRRHREGPKSSIAFALSLWDASGDIPCEKAKKIMKNSYEATIIQTIPRAHVGGRIFESPVARSEDLCPIQQRSPEITMLAKIHPKQNITIFPKIKFT